MGFSIERAGEVPRLSSQRQCSSFSGLIDEKITVGRAESEGITAGNIVTKLSHDERTALPPRAISPSHPTARPIRRDKSKRTDALRSHSLENRGHRTSCH